MKRTAEEAFAAGPIPALPVPFQPSGTALIDPKEYFQQWQQVATAQAAAAEAAAAVPKPAPTMSHEKSEQELEIVKMSAVRIAAIVKDKGVNFTPAVAIQALYTMATKSSFKLREELIRQSHVKWLLKHIQDIIQQPPANVTLEQLSAAAWSLIRFPNEALGDAEKTLGATARRLGTLSGTSWSADTASRVLWSLAKAEVIGHHKPVVSKVVQELVRDQGRRVAELSHEGLGNMLWAVARARRHLQKGELQVARVEENDETLFQLASKRICKEVGDMDVRILAEIAHTHVEIGIRNKDLFQAMCPRIVAKMKELDEKSAAKVIKAYARFMIPLKEEQQGFRTMAVVQKGDFIRPSDKPKKTGKKTYDHPQALYPKTPIFGRA